ncbi:flagellar hook-basal body protein [Bacillus sp. FJAT-49736]|uniref:flagellar hook-basal body protein n=1 Tax=Bacillus sp. FJAT-49736 TaxID=2833582 RepID=UPI001BC95D8F|nr:flagellar hook-basal body protein [Bacillus sp. FJAT-49736]MBS4175441.1 flagellar hook-basal body protein [Bacillus sp. FJAT-49736]
MNRSMIVASNTLNQLQKQLDIISNNMANVETNGYKKREVTFTDLLFQQFNNQLNPNNEIGRNTALGIRLGAGAKMAQSQMLLTQGSLKETKRPLDVAFTKENQFLKVLTSDNGQNEVRYTRDGNLSVSPVGKNEVMLVNSSGYPVLDENNKMITFPANAESYTITSDGRLLVKQNNGQTNAYNLGVIAVNKPQFLEQYGDNLIGLPKNGVAGTNVLTNLVGAGRNNISIQQGALEGSNVDLGQEMTELINVQREYQFQSRTITISDQMMGLVNGLR